MINYICFLHIFYSLWSCIPLCSGVVTNVHVAMCLGILRWKNLLLCACKNIFLLVSMEELSAWCSVWASEVGWSAEKVSHVGIWTEVPRDGWERLDSVSYWIRTTNLQICWRVQDPSWPKGSNYAKAWGLSSSAFPTPLSPTIHFCPLLYHIKSTLDVPARHSTTISTHPAQFP